MEIHLNELNMYKNFEEMASDILEMANEFMPDKLIFLSAMTDSEQIILKVRDNQTNIKVWEGMRMDLLDTACNRIDFDRNEPLIIENVRKVNRLNGVQKILLDANINSYIGVPIILHDGEAFGTLCAVETSSAAFSTKSIQMFQKIAKMFSFYLDLERRAYRDSLTGLYNREFLSKHFHDFSASGGALFFLDLDGFKKVNDLYGHDKGDEVLKETARKLEEYMKRHSGFATRLGGDEFILNFVGLIDSEDLHNLAENLLVHLSSEDTQLADFRLSVSIGIASYLPGDSKSLNMLLKNADHALYRAKTQGKNTFRFY
ncbi:sensor domain-containing diguanylate cyclase [Bacillus sp. SJS]|uniref:sensor domain-containing diguanylate cyclase n=1 Tax=Bacillus sp. SJS TaxID=1423321 RepID=UPI0004DCB917|nr:sensor domain-containing diguanylate cyclase [Bacillus sp. SJS]KZZ84352.1 diguanylate cyclase [Bacillus sp. SJS]